MANQGMFSNLVREDLANSKPASNLAFNEKVKQMKEDGHEVYHFGFGQSPFPVPHSLVKCLQNSAHQAEYLPQGGIPKLRDVIVEMHKRHDDIELTPTQLLVAPGSKELIYLTIAVFQGDVLIPTPAWTTYDPQTRFAGKVPVMVHADKGTAWKITPTQLEKTVQSLPQNKNKILILTNPGNPSGLCFTANELNELSEVCRRNKIIVISDEIYARLTFNGEHHSMVTYYPEGTILTSGFSKCLSVGGWRLGYAHYPQSLTPLMNAVKSGASQTYSCGPAPMQFAIIEALTIYRNDIEDYTRNCAKILQAVGQYCHRELERVGVDGYKGEAGYYYIPDFEKYRPLMLKRGIKTGPQMTEALLKEAGVAVMPSCNFGRPESELTTRFCFVCFDGAMGLRAIENKDAKIGDEFVREYCAPVVQGIEKIKQWLHNL